MKTFQGRGLKIQIPLIIVFFLLASFFVYLSLPSVYVTNSRVLVTERVLGGKALSDSVDLKATKNLFFRQSDLGTMKSKEILLQIAKSLKMIELAVDESEEQRKIEEEQVYQDLKKSIRIISKSAENYIDIEVRRRDSYEAFQIANQFALVYRQYNLENKYRELASAMRATEEELVGRVNRIKITNGKIFELRKKLADLWLKKLKEAEDQSHQRLLKSTLFDQNPDLVDIPTSFFKEGNLVGSEPSLLHKSHALAITRYQVEEQIESRNNRILHPGNQDERKIFRELREAEINLLKEEQLLDLSMTQVIEYSKPKATVVSVELIKPANFVRETKKWSRFIYVTIVLFLLSFLAIIRIALG